MWFFRAPHMGRGQRFGFVLVFRASPYRAGVKVSVLRGGVRLIKVLGLAKVVFAPPHPERRKPSERYLQ